MIKLHDFKDRFKSEGGRYIRESLLLLDGLESKVDINEEHIFYPMNFLKEDKITKLYFIFKDRYQSVYFDESLNCTVHETIFARITRKKLLAQTDSQRDFKLDLEFSDGSTLSLDAREDTNYDWNSTFSNALEKIYVYSFAEFDEVIN